MKRIYCAILCVVLLISFLSSCKKECNHDWVDADCENPKFCENCGKEKGEPLGHNWIDATCTTPKHCDICSLQEGDALEHSVEIWNRTSMEMVAFDSYATYIGKCTFCDTEIEKKEKLTTLYENGQFILTPEEFFDRFDMQLLNYSFGRLYAKETIINDLYYIEIYECEGELFDYNKENSHKIGGFYLGIDENAEQKVSYKYKDDAKFCSILGYMSYDNIYTTAPNAYALSEKEYENLTDIISALIATCDPLGYEEDKIENVVNNVLRKGFGYLNSITYVSDIGEGYWSCGFGATLG